MKKSLLTLLTLALSLAAAPMANAYSTMGAKTISVDNPSVVVSKFTSKKAAEEWLKKRGVTQSTENFVATRNNESAIRISKRADGNQYELLSVDGTTRTPLKLSNSDVDSLQLKRLTPTTERFMPFTWPGA